MKGILSRHTVGSFPGFYSMFLPEQCWDREGKKIVVSETWGSLRVSCAICLSVFLSVCLSDCLSVCLSVCLVATVEGFKQHQLALSSHSQYSG